MHSCLPTQKKKQKSKITGEPTTGSKVSIHPNETNTVLDLSSPQVSHEGINLPKNKGQIFMHSAWPSLNTNTYLDHEKTSTMIEQYVKDKMFHDLVFILNLEMIAFSWEATSICQIVCDKFKVSKFEQTQFWSIYSNRICQKLNKKRSEVSNGMRKVFKCK